MRINHNIAALNTYNKMSANSTATQGSLEKLSSGLKINKAGDDAAGLAISEKMRGQIRGLDMASKNAQDGISMIQTAEGGLSETQSILQRMRELSVQSASDSNNDNDRAELQKEVDQLSQEVQRISKDTQFNTKNLLDGKADDLTFHIGANEGQSINLSINDMSATALAVGTKFTASTPESGDATVTYKDATGTEQTATYKAAETVTVSGNGTTYKAADGTVGTWSDEIKEGDIKTPAVLDDPETDGVNESAPEEKYTAEDAREAGYYTEGGEVVK
ncbi:flagellin N-terminal helical domain-containing protein, partial [Terribacillus saccharophilus]|uniref:flagellin N-terminal helical domain-containing protein n=1 Tax=Terribacillus saccharophilus TaxID=361277 RepID=UPI002DCC3C1E|nr:flagellin [Terribacillus saccharophilus]